MYNRNVRIQLYITLENGLFFTKKGGMQRSFLIKILILGKKKGTISDPFFFLSSISYPFSAVCTSWYMGSKNLSSAPFWSQDNIGSLYNYSE